MAVLDLFSLKGRAALVTGAGSGFGRAFALALAEAGADVACVDIHADTAAEAAAEVADRGVRSLALTVDVTKKAQVQSMVDSVVAAFGRLDIGVNNAGIARGGDAESLDEARWDDVMDANLKSVFLCCQAEARVMLPRGYGKIVNTASMSATIVNRPQNQSNYNAAKAGVVHLTKSCAAEWATRGVRVNCISPGHSITPMTAPRGETGMMSIWRSNTPMDRLGLPADYVGALIYLASGASDYATGLDLIVDGGYTLW
jgi:NAD(P)-dependent dehydrogenase (short-subunit alcohol dehydrogenase family)